MITTTYTCDRCGQTQEKSREGPIQFWTITVTFSSGYGESTAHDVLWCRPCAELFCILRPKLSASGQPVPQPTQPTLDDLIRAIVREEIQ